MFKVKSGPQLGRNHTGDFGGSSPKSQSLAKSVDGIPSPTSPIKPLSTFETANWVYLTEGVDGKVFFKPGDFTSLIAEMSSKVMRAAGLGGVFPECLRVTVGSLISGEDLKKEYVIIPVSSKSYLVDVGSYDENLRDFSPAKADADPDDLLIEIGSGHFAWLRDSQSYKTVNFEGEKYAYSTLHREISLNGNHCMIEDQRYEVVKNDDGFYTIPSMDKREYVRVPIWEYEDFSEVDSGSEEVFYFVDGDDQSATGYASDPLASDLEEVFGYFSDGRQVEESIEELSDEGLCAAFGDEQGFLVPKKRVFELSAVDGGDEGSGFDEEDEVDEDDYGFLLVDGRLLSEGRAQELQPDGGGSGTVKRGDQFYDVKELKSDGEYSPRYRVVGHDVIGYAQSYVPKAYNGPGDTLKPNPALEELYAKIDRREFILAFLATMLSRPQDGKFSEIKEANFLLPELDEGGSRYGVRLIDPDEMFPANNVVSLVKEYAETGQVHPLRCGLMAMPFAAEELRGEDRGVAVDAIQRILDTKMAQMSILAEYAPAMREVETPTESYAEGFEAAYADVLVRIENAWEQLRNQEGFSLQDLLFAAYPEYKEHFELGLTAFGGDRAGAADAVGYCSKEFLAARAYGPNPRVLQRLTNLLISAEFKGADTAEKRAKLKSLELKPKAVADILKIFDA